MRIIGASFLVAATLLAACSEQPVRQTSAVVVNIAPGLHPKWDTDKVQVTARSLNGLVTVKNVPLAEFKCHVGDTVSASVQGLTLTLDDRAVAADSSYLPIQPSSGPAAIGQKSGRAQIAQMRTLPAARPCSKAATRTCLGRGRSRAASTTTSRSGASCESPTMQCGCLGSSD